jgi:cobalt/nickel transport system permease protein
MGAALATILLGPWAAVLVMTSVVAIQALIFQDGGLLVLGANIFNMSIVGVAVAYFIFTSIKRIAGDRSWGIFVAGFLAAWFSIVVAALATGLELSISGTSPANIAIPAMAGIHALIGIGEGLITVGALTLVYATRPDLLKVGEERTLGGTVFWVSGFFILLLLVVASPLASANPDGLEWVAAQRGFLDNARGPLYQIIPDYLFPGLSNEALATILAGVFGTLIVFGVVILAAYSRSRLSTGTLEESESATGEDRGVQQ